MRIGQQPESLRLMKGGLKAVIDPERMAALELAADLFLLEAVANQQPTTEETTQ